MAEERDLNVRQLFRYFENGSFEREEVERFLDERPCINDEFDNDIDGKSVLSHLYANFPWDMDDDEAGKYLLEVTHFFIDHGFDVRRFGGECLYQLCWVHTGNWVLEMAKALLDAGATTEHEKEEPSEDISGVMEAIQWELDNWNTGQYDHANLMAAYEALITAYEDGRDYHGYYAVDTCIGKRITRVSALATNEAQQQFNETQPHRYREALVLWCEETPLYVRKYPELFINPEVATGKYIETDVTAQYEWLVGKRIQSLQFIEANVALLELEGTQERLLFTCARANQADDVFGIAVPSIPWDTASLANIITDIYAPDETYYSHHVRVYEEKCCVLECGDQLYLIYSNADNLEETVSPTLRCLKVGGNILQGKWRRLKLDDLRLQHQLIKNKTDGTISGLRIQCTSGYLYVVAGQYSLEVFLTPTLVEDTAYLPKDSKECLQIHFSYKELD